MVIECLLAVAYDPAGRVRKANFQLFSVPSF